MIVIMGELASPPVHNNVLITPQSTCRMQETPAGAELQSNVLRRGAISGPWSVARSWSTIYGT
ncbi:hypothetical protein M6B38_310180 [Iris pallida]|uniref:Uncharacterized protein n=1 Tax=Iris pallida TaxID=29817 RepID=A0AAX6HIK0_IRIPA|nr:hypothetical protein M6B38_310180 [Iris pallida]